MSHNYETMYILRPDLSEEQVEEAIKKYLDLLKDLKAEDIQMQNRGKRRLAYVIEKYQDGFYVQLNYKGDGKQVAPFERAMRLSEDVIRYLTITIKNPSSLESKEEVQSATVKNPAPPASKEETQPAEVEA